VEKPRAVFHSQWLLEGERQEVNRTRTRRIGGSKTAGIGGRGAEQRNPDSDKPGTSEASAPCQERQSFIHASEDSNAEEEALSDVRGRVLERSTRVTATGTLMDLSTERRSTPQRTAPSQRPR